MKKFLSLILALAMILSLSSLALADQGTEVIVGLAGDPGNIGPFQGMGLGRIGILFTTYEMLMVKEGDTFRGCLMKELTQVDDLTYDVELYDYIKDQDGNPLTASDIKFCYETAKASGNLPKLSAVESVEVLSEYVARFKFTALAAGDLESLLMECPIVTQKAYEQYAEQMGTYPVTTSPYRVTSYQTGSTIVYERVADYWQKDELLPLTSNHNVDKITFKIIPDAVQMVNALKTREIDISAAIDSAYIKDFMDVDGFNVTQIPDNTTKYLIFNNNVFGDANLRKAIAYGIDNEDISLFAFDGVALLAKDIGNSKYPDYVPAWDDEEYFEYDADKASELFAAAGVSSATYRLMYNVSDVNTAIATTIQSDLMDFGINLELIPYDNALFGTYKFSENNEWDI
ncbi:MAG: ABC transporter substrate-binding protein, partial [Clostridia bacterium]|nr:ABC transporter substrate-binding protein [Clostridia bacterium]